MDIKQLDKTYIANTYNRFPVVLESGRGSELFDSDGKRYIDMGTGIAVNTFGAADPVWCEAVTRQLTRLQHTSNLYYTEPDVMLAKELCDRTGMKKVFFSNSGAEANECAIKAARKYAELNHPERNTIVTLRNSFHGRTLTTLAATGQDVFHKDFLPLTGGFAYANANLASVRKLVAEGNVSAILIEIVQGEGGVVALDKAFVQGLAELAEAEDILLMIDEVQTGNGRTGELFAYMNHSIRPDVVTTAKGLGGGLPLGATLLGSKVKDVFGPGSHGSTFGGNPVCCAGALSILQRIDRPLLDDVKAKSVYIREALTGAAGITGISGMGLMLGIGTEKPAAEVVADCLERGVLVLQAKDKVRLLPALNIPWNLLEEAVGVIKSAARTSAVKPAAHQA